MAQAESYSHAVNGRFKGGWITRNYGRPADGVNAVQMEIACRAYMDEQPPFAYDEVKAGELKTVLASLLRTVVEWVEDEQPLWQHQPSTRL